MSYTLKCQARWWRRNVTTVILFWEVAKEPFVSHAAKSDTSLFQGRRVVIIEQAGLPFHGRQCISRCTHNDNKRHWNINRSSHPRVQKLCQVLQQCFSHLFVVANWFSPFSFLFFEKLFPKPNPLLSNLTAQCVMGTAEQLAFTTCAFTLN